MKIFNPLKSGLTFKLCYVKDLNRTVKKLYFTTQSINKQSGNGWDISSYEVFSEPPYIFKKGLDTKKYHIYELIIEHPCISTPSETHQNVITNLSDLTVNNINKGTYPWLIYGNQDEPELEFFAGCKLNRILKFALKYNIQCYSSLEI